MLLERPFSGMLAGILLFLICYPFLFKKNKLFHNLCLAGLFVYSGALISLTMIYTPPSNWNVTAATTRWAILHINYTPFRSSIEIFENCRQLGDYSTFLRLIGGNFVMLMPLSILVPLINPKFRFAEITLLGIAVSFSIEALQLGSNILLGNVFRAVEIDDFIQNVTGCAVAYLIFALCRYLYMRLRHKRQI